MSSNAYRLNHPEYREKERIRDAERKKEKYNKDPEYREKRIAESLKNYYKNKPPFRKCRTCEEQLEYKPRIVYCINCYKKHTNWEEPKVEFIKEE